MWRGGCRCRLRRGGSLRYTQISQGHLLITLAFNYLSLILYMTLSESFTPRVCVSICKMLVNYLMPTNCFEIPKWNALSLQLPSLEAWCVLVSARISAKSSRKERSPVLNTPQGSGEPLSCPFFPVQPQKHLITVLCKLKCCVSYRYRRGKLVVRSWDVWFFYMMRQVGVQLSWINSSSSYLELIQSHCILPFL